jgi:quercetin dioxygenase-like cupin family protein
VDPAKLRRIVTGADGSGRAVIVSDGVPTLVPSGDGWIAEEWTAASAADDRDLSGQPWRVAPPAGGWAFRLAEFAPAGRPGSSSPRHATPTMDCLVVLSGRLWLRLDDEEVEVGPGDSVVQRGTAHAWENREDEPCVVAVFLMSREAA